MGLVKELANLVHLGLTRKGLEMDKAAEQMVEILKKLGDTNSEKEWDAVCDEVKAGVKSKTLEGPYSGDYPQWWFHQVVMSGLMARTQAKWGD
jgi:hypothetical protein